MNSRSRQALVIETEPDLAGLLERHLEDLGCAVATCHDSDAGIARALDGTSWNLVILDRNPAGLDGLLVCRKLRASANELLVLVLGGRASELDMVLCLESGADDYIARPLSIIEFVARAKALLRRSEMPTRRPPPQPSLLCNADLEIDLDKHIARRDGRELSLTVKEFDLLAFLMRHPQRVFTRAQLLDQVWGSTCLSFEHTVNSHINRLRAKLEPSPTRPRYIHTVWGVGYRLAPTPAAARLQGSRL